MHKFFRTYGRFTSLAFFLFFGAVKTDTCLAGLVEELEIYMNAARAERPPLLHGGPDFDRVDQLRQEFKRGAKVERVQCDFCKSWVDWPLAHLILTVTARPEQNLESLYDNLWGSEKKHLCPEATTKAFVEHMERVNETLSDEAKSLIGNMLVHDEESLKMWKGDLSLLLMQAYKLDKEGTQALVETTSKTQDLIRESTEQIQRGQVDATEAILTASGGYSSTSSLFGTASTQASSSSSSQDIEEERLKRETAESAARKAAAEAVEAELRVEKAKLELQLLKGQAARMEEEAHAAEAAPPCGRSAS